MAKAAPGVRLKWENVIAWRARRQQLHERAPLDDLDAVARRIGGLHAQLMSSAEMTAWVRVVDIARDRFQGLLWEKHAFIKTWAMRGTLHLIPASEYWVWQTALTVYSGANRAQWLQWYGISEKEFGALMSAIPRALANEPLTRAELSAAVGRITRSKRFAEILASGWGTMLKPSAAAGNLCFARGEGQKVRFTRPDRLIGNRVHVDPDEALREVTRRYFAVHGPGTREDLARWWGVRPPHARKMIDALGDDIVPVDVEGRRAFTLADDIASMQSTERVTGVRLLPAFDQYVVGATRQVDAVLPDAHRDKVYRPNAWFSAVLLVDGRMAGIWKHERKGKRLIISVKPFAKLPKRVRTAAAQEAADLSSFLGGQLDLVWADPRCNG